MIALAGIFVTISIFILSFIFSQMKGTEVKASGNTTDIEVVKIQIVELRNTQIDILQKFNTYLDTQNEIFQLLKDIRTRLIK